VGGGFDGDFDLYRAIIARENLKLIEEHNRNPTATFKMEPYRQFLALTPDEVRARYLTAPSSTYLRPSVFTSGIKV
jgi:hypothetical protein